MTENESAPASPAPIDALPPLRSPREEMYNVATHFFGLMLSLAGVIAMLPKAVNSGRPILVASIAIYLFALVAVYACSTLSHAFNDDVRRQRYRKLDQAFIYLLIIASYSPFSIVFLNTSWFWSVLALMWAIGLAGFFSKLFFSHRVNSVAIWIYLGLGWIPAISGMPFTPMMPAHVLWSIIGGGILFTIGTFFLYNDHVRIYFHAIWHLLVIGGTGIHYWAILNFVL